MQGVYAIHVTGESHALTAGDLDDRYRRYLSYHGYKAGSMLYIFDNKARTLPRRRRKESAIIDKALLSYMGM